MGELDVVLKGKSLGDYTNTQLRLALGAVLYTNTADMWKAYLNQQGYTGSVSDMLQRYYVDKNVPNQFRNYISAGIYLNASSGDPNFASVSALLHFEGTDASTTFTDVTGKTWTASGNSQIDVADKKFGDSSGLFDTTSDWLSTPNSADFSMPSDFTIETWIKIINAGTGDKAIFVSAGSGGLSFGLINGKLQLGANAVAYDVQSSANVPTGEWVHVAGCRSGTTLRLFINGVIDGSVTNSRNYTSAGSHFIGGIDTNSGFSINSWLDELRITKGVARYTANFTPPTSAFPDS